MRIRNAARQDMAPVTEIYGHSVRTETSSFELEPPDIETMTARWEALVAGDYPYLVAVDDAGTVAGYAYASAYRPRPAYTTTVECSVYVAAGFRRRGVARLLMSALIERCRENGARQMIAMIGDSSNTASIALHEALGFTHVGTLKDVGHKFDQWLDVVLMQRAL